MCCGRSRAQFLTRTPRLPPPRVATQTVGPPPQFARYPGMTFEYIGLSGLTVTGPVTGRRYRFDRPGTRVEVDRRDRASIAAIPLLRPVR